MAVLLLRAVATYMGEVHSRASQNADSVRVQVEPYITGAGDAASKKLTDLASVLDAQGDTIRTQLESSMRELRTSMDTRLDELTELIVPYATKIREQFEEVMSKVKDTNIQ